MKRILLILSMMWGVAYGQKVLMEAGNRRSLTDSAAADGTSNIAMWGMSFIGDGVIPNEIQRLSKMFVYNGGIGGQTTTQIKDRFILDTLKWKWNTIIYAVRNDLDSATAVGNVNTMVSKLPPNTRYFIVGASNAGGEPSGSANYISIQKINTGLAGIYGSKFIDIRPYWVSLYNPALPGDVTNHNQDIPPLSTRRDSIHPNTATYKLLARYIWNYVASTFSNQTIPTYEYAKKGYNAGYFPGGIYIDGQVSRPRLPSIRFWDGNEGTQDPLFSDLNVRWDGITWGYLAGNALNITTGYGSNYLIGNVAGRSITSGTANTALGDNSWKTVTTGVGNTGFGYYTGSSPGGASSFNTYIGYQAGGFTNQLNPVSNSGAFGAYAINNRSNQVTIGAPAITNETQLAGQVGVNLTYAAPKTNAQFQINSDSKGFMPPRMTAAQRLAMTMVAGDSSLIVFDKDSARLMMYDGAGWKGLSYTNQTQAPLSFSSGVRNTAGTVTNDLITGVNTSQVVVGGTAANQFLYLRGNNAASGNTGASLNTAIVVGDGAGIHALDAYNNGITQVYGFAINPSTSTITQTLGTSSGAYAFTGSTATWTLPTPSVAGQAYYIKNRGSGSLTINATGGGAVIYDTGAVTSISIGAGGGRYIWWDGTFWNVN